MFIYLDANLVEYCANYGNFIFGKTTECPIREPKLRYELLALKELVELEQLGNWDFAAPQHLLAELYAGNPSEDQLSTYKALREAWEDRAGSNEPVSHESEIAALEQSLMVLNLKDAKDRRHLAEAIALSASWFLTNDKDILKKTSGKDCSVRISRPSECVRDISTGLFLK